jgi:hypothetical protein
MIANTNFECQYQIYRESVQQDHEQFRASVEYIRWLHANGLYRRNDNRDYNFARGYVRTLRWLGR